MALNIPLPKIVPDVGPGGGVFDVYNRLTNEALKQRKQELENLYYGPTAQANALSKAAYAKYAGPEAIAKLLALPNTMSNLSEDQYKALVQQGNQALMNAPNINIPAPQPEPQGIIPSILGMIFGKMGRKEAAQNQQTQFDQSQQVQNTPNVSNGLLKPPPAPTQETITPTHPITPSQLGYNTPSMAQAAGLVFPGTMGGFSPATAAKAQEQAAVTSATGQAQTANKQWEDRQNSAAQAANDAASLVNFSKSFHSTYPKAYYTGARLGSLPSKGLFAPPSFNKEGLSYEQTLDQLGGNMQAQVAKLLGGNRLTNQELTLAGNLKLGRFLDPDAEKNIYNSVEATANRIRTRQKFYNAIRNSDPSINPNEADILWDIYNVDYPPYDVSTFKPLTKNDDKWKEFATQKAINELRQTGEYKSKKPYKLEIDTTPVVVLTPSGKPITLPKEGALRLIKDHPDHRIVG